MKRAGRVWIRIFPDVPVSKKPLEVRMGSGKGAPEFWVARVKPGRILFEIDGVSVALAREALGLAAAKLPIKTRFVERIARVGRGLMMKPADLRAMTRRPARRRAPEAQEGAVQPALPAGDRPAREHRARARRCAATSRGSRPIAAQKRARAGGAESRTKPKRAARRRRSRSKADAEAHAAGRRGERQAGQDHRRARRAPLHPSGHEEDRAALEEVPRPRRDERVSRSATSSGSRSAGRSPSSSAGK